MEIRLLAPGDGMALVELLVALFPEWPAATAEGVEEAEAFLAAPTSYLLAAFVEGDPVGLAWGNQMRSPIGRLTTYLHQLDVHADHRRRGIATALVRRAMDVGRERGSSRFWLSTGGHNEGAQALYDSLGGDRKPLGDVNYWWELD